MKKQVLEKGQMKAQALSRRGFHRLPLRFALKNDLVVR
jgi:hypothetical protein